MRRQFQSQYVVSNRGDMSLKTVSLFAALALVLTTFAAAEKGKRGLIKHYYHRQRRYHRGKN